MHGNQDKLGTMPIAPLLIKMSVPMMISMLVQALYNTVDSMFVARISEDALAAVSLAFPIQTVITALGVGTGVGTGAYVSRCLGMGDRKNAEKAANVQIFISAIYTLFFVLLGIFAVRKYFSIQTDVQSIINYGSDYLGIILCFCIGAVFIQNFEKLLLATGNSAQSMIAQTSGALFNILFDWLLIFGIGPFPELGIRGAAIATVLGQMLTAIMGFIFIRKYSGLRFRFSLMLPRRDIVKNIYTVGIPCMLTVGTDSIMSFFMNQILLGFSTTATAVFGIWLRLQNLSFMPTFGLNNGAMAIYSYNYGAGNLGRIQKNLRCALILGVCVSIAITLFYELCPGFLLRLFDAGENMMSIGRTALHWCCISLPLATVSLILSSSFESLGSPHYSFYTNFCRQVLFLAPVAWLLSLSGVLSAVWPAAIIAECAGVVVAIVLNKRVHRRLARELGVAVK